MTTRTPALVSLSLLYGTHSRSTLRTVQSSETGSGDTGAVITAVKEMCEISGQKNR